MPEPITIDQAIEAIHRTGRHVSFREFKRLMIRKGFDNCEMWMTFQHREAQRRGLIERVPHPKGRFPRVVKYRKAGK